MIRSVWRSTEPQNQERDQGDFTLKGSDPRVRGSRRVEEKALPDPHRAVHSGVGVIFHQLVTGASHHELYCFKPQTTAFLDKDIRSLESLEGYGKCSVAQSL